jgi:xanthine/CO dehydrogenase XdhC/CoxF family maturation factor
VADRGAATTTRFAVSIIAEIVAGRREMQLKQAGAI